MDSEEIQNKAESNNATKDKFIGVFPADKLPKKKTKPEGYYIVNLDNSNQGGSHWVCIECRNTGLNSYFDSYGLPPPYPSFRKFMKNKYRYNSRQLQHPLSTTCGQWCLYYVLRRCQGWKMEKIISPFKRNFLANDHTINHLIKVNFNTNEKVIDRQFLHKQISQLMQDTPIWKYYLQIVRKNEKKKKKKLKSSRKEKKNRSRKTK